MNTPIHIREATNDDLTTICHLGATTFKSTYDATTKPEVMRQYVHQWFSPAQIQQELSNPKIQFFLLSIDNIPIGYAKLRWDKIEPRLDPLPSICLDRIYFLKEHQGKGLGRKMIDHLATWSKERNYQVIWLTVWPENPLAVNFYKKYGFEIFGMIPFNFAGIMEEDYAMKYVMVEEGSRK